MNNFLKLILLFACLLSVQSTALQHEFSSEHLFSNGYHNCLAQAIHLDSSANAEASALCVQQAQVCSGSITPSRTNYHLSRVNARFARAPPVFS